MYLRMTSTSLAYHSVAPTEASLPTRGRSGTVFAIIEDKTQEDQLLLCTTVLARCRRDLGAPGSGHGIAVGRDCKHHLMSCGVYKYR